MHPHANSVELSALLSTNEGTLDDDDDDDDDDGDDRPH
jgi:hypothetical protein